MASNEGRIKSIDHTAYSKYRPNGTKKKGKIKNQTKSPKGYKRLNISDSNNIQKSRASHRLIALAFIPNHDNKPFINHIDGDKANNNIENLEWCTCSENTIHAFRIGLRKVSDKARQRAGESLRLRLSKPLEQLDLSGNLIAKFSSGKEASVINKFSQGGICRAASGMRRTYKGFLWRYK